MIYVMSDLHGCYDKYEKMLKKINFNSNDTLYILGDVADRGKDGLKIMLDMLKKTNVIPLLGNHDYMAYCSLKYINLKNKPEWWQEIRDEWMLNGGYVTEKEFFKLNKKEQQNILDYLEEFIIYKELKINGKTYILSHAGIDNFDKNKSLDDYELYDFISGRMDYNKIYFSDKYLISGHTTVRKKLCK